ncbi:hypothetical protein [Desulfatirhabdium butyrativorans]|uniref:hypothetical protein n=1 Tax=Desulfatirhabdium butyrativorans TaxID=340467 RepID=UPI000413DBE3|nr:hypothetical protein [Desulfatirhabdium butyrativorans]
MNELLATCLGPDLDNIKATAVLSELRKICLYLRRIVFVAKVITGLTMLCRWIGGAFAGKF